MKLKRVMIAALGSGSGKTTITCALLQTLKTLGLQAAACKCGPDYIDPLFHEKVLGVPSKNLDTFFTGEAETRELFLRDRTERDFVVLEGVMGLYDGLGGICREGSSYHLASVTRTPIILVADAKGMGRSVIPLIAGFLAYDREHLIKGVILNRMRGSFYEVIRPIMEKELGIRVLGYLEEDERLRLESRHLGLMLPEGTGRVREWLETAEEAFRRTVSVREILEIAQQAEELQGGIPPARAGRCTKERGPVIAVARDEAFCFYYEDNLRMLREYGAETVFFSPLCDKGLPEGCCGLLLGGGYPEVYAKELGANDAMLHEIRGAVAGGMPTVAECGGFLYLHSSLIDKEGNRYPMAGVIPALCRYAGRSVRFGYVELEEKTGFFLPAGERIKGHEFHYFDSSDNGCGCVAVKPASGRQYSCVMTGESFWMGFPHLYYPSNPSFVKSFVRKAEKYRERTGAANAGFPSFF